MEKEPKRWYFTRETTAQGLIYIYAYQTQWDPVQKRSRRISRKYVGRLTTDGSVRFGKNFLAAFPQYAEGTWYYGADKTLVNEAAYRTDFPAPEPASDDPHEESPVDQICSTGLCWALRRIAETSGMLGHLTEVFGEHDAEALLSLALFRLHGNRSMAAFGTWLESVRLPRAPGLSGPEVCDLLSRVQGRKFSQYFLLRRGNPARRSAEDAPKLRVFAGTVFSFSPLTLPGVLIDPVAGDRGRPRIRCVFADDPVTGEIVFAHAFDGALPAEISADEILHSLREAGIDPETTILATDLPLQTLLDVDGTLPPRLSFVQSADRDEEPVLRNLDRLAEPLRDLSAWDPRMKVFARSAREDWLQFSAGGCRTVPIHQHLFLFPAEEDAERAELTRLVQELIEFRSQGRTAPPGLEFSCGCFVRETRDGLGRTVWRQDGDALNQALRHAGAFAIRSNAVTDPLEALRIWQMRAMAVQDFEKFWNWADEDPLRGGASMYWGRLLVCTLAASLRLTALCRAQAHESTECRIPDGSIERVFMILRGILAQKRAKANSWVTFLLTEKQRGMLALLGVGLPPRTSRL